MSTHPKTTSSTPEYIHIFEFEKFDYQNVRFWLKEEGNWTLVIYASIIYTLGIVFGQKYMKTRKPYDTKRILLFWNILQAAVSAALFLRMFPEVYVQWTQRDLQSTFCSYESFHNIATEFWGVVFCVSKILDFGDTALLVLSKKPVIFLHWYHHLTVALYCFYSSDTSDPASRWFAIVNSAEHFKMYTYFALTSLRFKMPRSIAMLITTLQLAQMIFGMYINISTYRLILNNIPCNRPIVTIYISLATYSTYFILFAKFFFSRYLASKPKIKST